LIGDTVLEIIAQGTWNGGKLVDNSIFENKALTFKGGVPVNPKTIEQRIGVRTRKAAPRDQRIGVLALKNVLQTSIIDPSNIKLIIGATNIGDDKHDSGPLIRHPYKLIQDDCPEALALDIYAGCSGFNAAVELVYMMSLAGILKPGDRSIIVGAENIQRAKVFLPDDTANIIFGDDAMATVLETKANEPKSVSANITASSIFSAGSNFTQDIANKMLEIIGIEKIDGIIVDNQLGKLEYRVPATAARIQQHLIEKLYPNKTADGTFKQFRRALKFYNQHVNCFAFDIMSLKAHPDSVAQIAGAYATSVRYKRIASVYLAPDHNVVLTFHEGNGYNSLKPTWGVIDTLTQSHGCFTQYIEFLPNESDGEVFGKMDGKGVFLHATRGAKHHWERLMCPNNLTINDIDLLIEHQANFAIIPLTLEKVFKGVQTDLKKAVAEFIANKMVTNIHIRGNCSVVCMQRLPHDLIQDVLLADTIRQYPINQNLENLKNAKTILYDSIGSGMTRSSFLHKKKN